MGVDGGWRRANGRGGELRSHGGERSNRGAEGKAERFHTEERRRAALSSPRGLSAHPPGGRGWELRLGLRSDRRERTGVGGVNAA